VWKSKVGQLLLQKSAKVGRKIEQQELAQEIGVEENTVSRWVRGIPMTTINAHTVQAYCKYFDVEFWDVVELVDDDPETETHPDGKLDKVA
jgi:DNA-binding Xre family transcriptional regulator